MNYEQRVRKTLLISALAFLTCAPPPVPDLDTATYAPALEVDLANSTKVSGMYIRDITIGDAGVAITAGTRVSMNYTGWLADGTQFDTNQAAGFPFVVGAGTVIDGWDLGVPGMLANGERQLIIPPSLGYGEDGAQGIPGNSILIFNVKLKP